MKNLLLTAALICATVFTFGQDSDAKKDFVAMFYNVENLFDTIDDPKTKDNEFLPTAEKQWNTQKYNRKLNNLSMVIQNVKRMGLPDIVGLAEVENKTVLNDLLNYRNMLSGRYKIVHEDSKYNRGVDVALFYNPKTFKYVSHETTEIEFPFDKTRTTRAILYVKGKLENDEELHVFVNHWPSRWGGVEQSEPKRVHVATVLRKLIDELKGEKPGAKILVLGDFNDAPTNKSLSETLGSVKKPDGKGSLVNLAHHPMSKGLGTYNYKGNWDMLDQAIVSENMIDAKKGLSTCTDCLGIFDNQMVTYMHNKSGQLRPNRTYGGSRHYGGYSDHYAIYVGMEFK